MIALANEVLVHSLVAALVVGALLREWQIRQAGLRLALHASALLVPLVALPVFHFGAPGRRGAWFEEHVALFVGTAWGRLDAFGVPLDVAWFGLFAACGLALFLLDTVPFLRGRAGREAPLASGAAAEAIRARVETLARERGLAAPLVRVLASPQPVLYCRGVRRPELVVSTGVADRLPAAELDGALAHELAHLVQRDAGLFWFLWIVRAVQAFNPVAQVVSRSLAADAEWRADDHAARTTGDRLAVAAALLHLFRASNGRRPAREPLWGPFVARAREEAIERRCRRLLDDVGAAPVPYGHARIALTTTGLFLLLFVVR